MHLDFCAGSGGRCLCDGFRIIDRDRALELHRMLQCGLQDQGAVPRPAGQRPVAKIGERLGNAALVLRSHIQGLCDRRGFILEALAQIPEPWA